MQKTLVEVLHIWQEMNLDEHVPADFNISSERYMFGKLKYLVNHIEQKNQVTQNNNMQQTASSLDSARVETRKTVPQYFTHLKQADSNTKRRRTSP